MATSLLNYPFQVGATPALDPREFNFVFTNGTGVNGPSMGTAGSQTLTFTTSPLGTSGTDSAHYLYVNDITTPSLSEAVLITGGNATPLKSGGTLTFTTVNAHTGSWQIMSATAGIQEAMLSQSIPGTVEVPMGTFTLYGPVTIPAASTSPYVAWRVIGQGRQTSIFNIATSFPLGVNGVFMTSFPPASPGPSFSDLGWVFQQPYASPLSSFNHWPACVYSVGVGQMTFERLYVSGGWNGFYVHGSPVSGAPVTQFIGQIVFDDIYLGTFGTGIDIDGAADVIRLDKIHFWPFTNTASFPPGYTNAQYNPLVVGLKIGEVTGVNISDSWFLTGTSVIFTGGWDGNQGAGVIQFSNCGFDVFGMIDMSVSAGGITCTMDSCFWFQDTSAAGFTATRPCIDLGNNPPQLTIANSFLYKSSITQSFISSSGPSGSNPAFAQLNITGCIILENSNSASAASIFALNSGTGNVYYVNITGCNIAYSGNQTYTNPMCAVTGSSGIALNFKNNCNSGIGTGTWLSIAYDDHHNIAGNTFQSRFAGAWTNSYPASKLIGNYQPINNLTPPTIASSASIALGTTGSFVYYITGTTQITTITGMQIDQIYTFIFTNASPGGFGTGGNIARAQTAAQNQAIRLVFDGTNWY